MRAKQILYSIYVTVLEHEQIITVRKYRFRITVKLCYSESGRPRHIFSLLPSSRYSQMTNLPRETKGNNLDTGAVDLRGLQCDGGCVTLGLRAGRERQRHRAHSSQTKMRGGRGGRGRGDYTPHKDAPFVVFLCYRPPRDVPYREIDDEVGVGRVARTFVARKDRKSLVITEMIQGSRRDQKIKRS